jgi:hypothetical protein
LQAPGGNDGDKEERLWLTNKDAFPTLDTMAPAEAGAAAARSPTPSPPPRRRTPVVVVDAIHSNPAVTLDTMALPDAGAQAARPRRKCVRPLGAAARSPTPPSPPRLRAPAKEKRECEHCGTDETPLWRKGPEGRPTLCNVCGMRFKKGKLLPEYRPSKCPIFDPDLHTNQHRRVLDMARCREEEARHPTPTPPAVTEGGIGKKNTILPDSQSNLEDYNSLIRTRLRLKRLGLETRK